MGINLTNTAGFVAATEILAAKSVKKDLKVVLTEEQEAGKAKTIAIITARAQEGQRTTYGALGLEAINNGWLTRCKDQKFDGQTGSGLVKHLPEELHPFVCQSSGRYDVKAKGSFTEFLPEMGEGFETADQKLTALRFMPAYAPSKDGKGTELRTFAPKVRAKKEVTEVASEDSAATL